VRRRILVAILSITGIAVLLFGIPLAIMVDRFVEQDATLRIERQAVLAARDVPTDFATSSESIELTRGTDGVSLAFYDRSGARVTGVGPAIGDFLVRTALTNQIATAESSGVIIVAIPVSVNEIVIGVIRGQQPTSTSDARTYRTVALVAGLGIGIIGIGAAIAFFVAERLARPVRRLRDAAVQLGNGDFTLDVSHSKVPEIDQAAEALALTARRLDDLVGRERAFSADASHQLRTPLAGLRAGIETELAFPRVDPTDILLEALDDITRLERTISELLAIARTPNFAASSCSLAVVQHAVEETWHGRFAAAGRRLAIEDAADTPALAGNGAILRHALDVLLDNALIHGDGAAQVLHVVGPESVTITVTDEGPGLAPMATPSGSVRVTEHKSSETSHGHGLPMAHRLINSMPGRLTVVHAGRHPRIDVVVGRADASADTDADTDTDTDTDTD
jgi:signal transduction histidine kinase